MFELKATATDDADWAVTLDLTDDDTNGPWDAAADMIFRIAVKDCGTEVLTATTEDSTITRPADNQIAWRFTASQMASLCPGTTYKLGGVWEDDDGNITQLFVGELAVLDGGFA